MTADAHRQGQRLVSFPPITPLWSRGLAEGVEALFMTAFRITYQEDIA
ncbi:hypothetical protein Psi02_20510 [Planotetraspora silvatica]|uniref:Uncharacterized protein n=1 Tax=Planotetraspora silvatica TaxID=234614 RepID=A0A8J3UKW7_9ACTN|nr:hypothetical protein [Planotetraspora silvatica]GII45627.1 hypothetical protein Psi02_20510 [Planotetraspora silvatica]